MHEYAPSHPMYRPQRFRLNADDRARLIQAITNTLKRLLGDEHAQIGDFLREAAGMNDERLMNVAAEHGAKAEWRRLKEER